MDSKNLHIQGYQYMETFYNAIYHYHENTQGRAEKSGCIFIFVGGQDFLNPAMPV